MQFFKKFNEFFSLGIVVRGPERMRFFGINTFQDEDMEIQTDADDKLNALTEYALSRPRRKQFGLYNNEVVGPRHL